MRWQYIRSVKVLIYVTLSHIPVIFKNNHFHSLVGRKNAKGPQLIPVHTIFFHFFEDKNVLQYTDSYINTWIQCHKYDCQPKHHLILNSFTYAHRPEEFSSKCHCLHFWETALTIETKIKMVWIRYRGSRSAFKVIIKLKEKRVIFIFLLYFLCNDFFCFEPCSEKVKC